MVELFSLDLGNKQTKLLSSKGSYLLPSHFIDKDSDSKKSALFDFNNSLDLQTFQILGSDDEYTWGSDVDNIHSNDDDAIVDTLQFGANRYGHEEFKLLVNFSLAKLAKDFEESKNEVLHVNVVTGLPTDDLANRSFVEKVTKDIKGEHSVNIDDNTIHVNVDKLILLPQPVGTLFNEINENDLTRLEDELVTIVDLGGGTVLIDTMDHLQYQKNTTKQLNTGAYTLFNAIIEDLDVDIKPTEYQVEDIIRNGSETGKYVFEITPTEKVDITEIVDKRIKKYTKSIIRSIRKSVTNLPYVADIVFTGGGSSIIDKDLIKAEFPKAIFAKHGEMTNVIGFYQYGINVLSAQK